MTVKTTHRPARKVPKKRAIHRAVASSTVIETGQSIDTVERTLRSRNSKFRNVPLAD